MGRKSAFAIERDLRRTASEAKAKDTATREAHLADARKIAPGMVRVETHHQNYRRTVNGAWIVGGADRYVREIEEDRLDGYSPGYSSHKVTWPDGHVEVMGFSSSLHATATGPRLRILNNYTVALLPWRKAGVMRAVGHRALVAQWVTQQERLDGYMSTRYAQDVSWIRPTKLDQEILEHFGEAHGNL